LLYAQVAYLRGVVFVAEEVEYQLVVVRPLRQYLAGHKCVVDLLDHQLREDRLDMDGGNLLVLWLEREDRIILQAEPLVVRADLLALVGRRIAVLGRLAL
jgi:hypothetical protein